MTQALEEAHNEREQKEKVFQENTSLGSEISTLRRNLQVCFVFLFVVGMDRSDTVERRRSNNQQIFRIKC